MQTLIAIIRKSFFAAQAEQASSLRVLGTAELRQVSGGAQSSPRTGW